MGGGLYGPRLARGFFLTAIAVSATALAAPYRPTDDEQVLARLPAGTVSGRLDRGTIRDAGTAEALARLYIKRARQDGDPRFLGYAEGVLEPWRNDPAPPTEVMLLRATLSQSSHKFDQALNQLSALLAREPRNAQALLTQATVLRVKGRYAEALASCQKLYEAAPGFVSMLCTSSVEGLHGKLRSAALALASASGWARNQAPAVRLWYYAERADMEIRRGRPQEALRIYQQAFTESGGDAGLRAAAADVLLAMGRPADVLPVIGDAPSSDLLKLRDALALRALGRPQASIESALVDTYAAARRRGEVPHLREESRFALDVENNAARALALARDNWEVQREPADALVLVEAAARAGVPDAVDVVVDWRRKSGMQDVRLDAALRRIGR